MNATTRQDTHEEHPNIFRNPPPSKPQSTDARDVAESKNFRMHQPYGHEEEGGVRYKREDAVMASADMTIMSGLNKTAEIQGVKSSKGASDKNRESGVGSRLDT